MARTLMQKPVYTPAPQGTHYARVISLVYLGTQESDFGTRQQIWVELELPNVVPDDGSGYVFSRRLKSGGPCRVSKFCTMSLNEKAALRAIIEAAIGRGLTAQEAARFNLGSILDRPLMVSIVNTESDKGTRARVSSFAPVPTGVEVPRARTPLLDFDFEEDGRKIPDELPDFISDVIKRSAEWQNGLKAHVAKLSEADVDAALKA